MADSSFVRQSLTDTATRPSRTLTSSRLAQRVLPATAPRPSSYTLKQTNSSSSIASISARKDAEEFCKVLGIPQPSNSPVHESRLPLSVVATPSNGFETPKAAKTNVAADDSVLKRTAHLEERLLHKDNEIAALKKQTVLLRKKVDDLTAANERLETEKAAGGAGSSGSRKLEEIERQFEAQELLLAGYQREAEKSTESFERVQAQNKKMAEALARILGPSWETELEMAPSNGRRNRQSLTTMPSLRVLADISNAEPSTIKEEREQDPSSPDPVDALKMKTMLESVQMLLRSMDARLISRSVELAALERKAEQGAYESKQRLKQMDALK